MTGKTKAILITTLMISLFGMFTACGDSEVKEENTDKTGAATDRSMVIDQAHQALADLTYSPYGEGFSYKSTDVPKDDFKSWLEKFKPQLEKALSAVGDGFTLQVTGHTCAIGPREAQPDLNKKGNMFYSKQRAQNVYDALVEAGLTGSAMTVVGIADDEPLPNIEAKDQRNRRVTFKLVEAKKQAE